MNTSTLRWRSEQVEVPLVMLPESTEAIVTRVWGGRGLVRRLLEMGFTQGARVKVLHCGGPGPVLVDVRGSRVALGVGVAMRILVRPEGRV